MRDPIDPATDYNPDLGIEVGDTVQRRMSPDPCDLRTGGMDGEVLRVGKHADDGRTMIRVRWASGSIHSHEERTLCRTKNHA